jgi:hypothetical protein
VSPAFVAACDKLGVMLMEEAFDCWDTGEVVNIIYSSASTSIILCCALISDCLQARILMITTFISTSGGSETSPQWCCVIGILLPS